MIGEIYRNSDSNLNNSKSNITTNINNQEALNHLSQKLEQHIPDSTPNRDTIISDAKDKILKRISNSNIVNQNTFKFSTRTLNSTVLDEVLNSNNVKNLIKEQLRSELNKQPNEIQIIQRISNLKSIITNYLNVLIDNYLNVQMSNFSGQIINIVSDNMNVASKFQDFSLVETLSTGLQNALLANLKSNLINIFNSLLPINILNIISSAYSISIDSNKANILSVNNSNIKGNIMSVTEFATYTISNSILPDRTTVDGNSTINNIPFINNRNNSTSSSLESFGKAFGTAMLAGAAIKTLSDAFSSMNKKSANNIPGNSNPIPNSNNPVDTTTNGMNNNSNNKRQSQNDQRNQNSKSTSNTIENRNNNQDESSTNNSNENNTPSPETYDNSVPSRANVKNDPRRDKCQELVLWETDKEKYVLLRDGIGNYILLDEDSGLIRIQHKSGSYIQLTSNIDIEAAGNVNINCAGSSYKKQF